MKNQRSITSFTNWSLIGLLVLSLLAAAIPQHAQAAPLNQVCDQTHVVKEGETIYKIARTYSKTVNRLAKTNNLEFPYRVTVGQTLCIPGRATGSANATWTATFANGKVTLNGTNFRKEYPFIIRVRENDTSAWYKLGQTKTNNAGVLNTTFNAPDALMRVGAINVCLKDAFTDVLVCKRAFRQ